MYQLHCTTTPTDDITFITNYMYVRAHGLTFLGKVGGHHDEVLILPSHVSKVHVSLLYHVHAQSNMSRKVIDSCRP